MQLLVGRRYDVIITDLTRPAADGSEDPEAGIRFLELLSGAPAVPPVIVYAFIADYRFEVARNAGASAATTVPWELLESVLQTLNSEPGP